MLRIGVTALLVLVVAAAGYAIGHGGASRSAPAEVKATHAGAPRGARAGYSAGYAEGRRIGAHRAYSRAFSDAYRQARGQTP